MQVRKSTTTMMAGMTIAPIAFPQVNWCTAFTALVIKTTK
jgi:hypothetical protein